MTVIRRVYVYLLCSVGLTLLAFGVAGVGRVLVEVLAAQPIAADARYVRDEVSHWGAGAIVGLPVWALHWWWAQRAAANLAERASTLRRLYLYATLAGAAIIGASELHDLVREGLDGWQLGRSTTLSDSLRHLPPVVVAAIVWDYQWRAATANRRAVGEVGGSATLRRWYIYGLAFLGLLALLEGSRGTLEALWRAAAGVPWQTVSTTITASAPAALIGLGLWLAHWCWLPARLGPGSEADDLRSTLRVVYLFAALAAAVAGTLVNLSQLLYYALGRLVGIDQPGGVGGSILVAAAGPTSAAIAYGVVWAYQRRAVRLQAERGEVRRQVGVRRFYTYLVALVAGAALAAGLGGLLWTLADAVAGTPETQVAGWWRDPTVEFATAVIVGLPVWLLHWRPNGAISADEARALTRRLYVYLALIGGMLALVIAGFFVLYRLLSVALGEPVTTSLTADLTHALAVTVVAAVVAAYHWQALRADAREAASQPEMPAPRPALEVLVRLRGPDEAAIGHALSSLREQGFSAEVLPQG